MASSLAMAMPSAGPIGNWQRLFHALHGNSSLDRLDSNKLASAGLLPPSNNKLLKLLGQSSNEIEAILQVADEIQADNINVSRLLSEHAYTLSQDLDANSEGRGVLQFKTGLRSLIKQKLAKKVGTFTDRSEDIAQIQLFYSEYKMKHNIDELQEHEQLWRSSSDTGIDPNKLERSHLKMEKLFATLGVFKSVVDTFPSELISVDFKKMLEEDAVKIEEFKAYNILPLGAPGIISNVILSSPEVMIKGPLQ